MEEYFNGGDTAFAIEKSKGDIYDMPFIGMSKKEVVFKNKTFCRICTEHIKINNKYIKVCQFVFTGREISLL